jgi:hypothetical protein
MSATTERRKARQRGNKPSSKGKRRAKVGHAPVSGIEGSSPSIGESLGAAYTFRVPTTPRGPFGVAALLDELRSRLVSKGGRPSDPAANIRRLVPLRRAVWVDLKRHARTLSAQGRPVSAGQLAAVILEQGVSELGKHQEKQ